MRVGGHGVHIIGKKWSLNVKFGRRARVAPKWSITSHSGVLSRYYAKNDQLRVERALICKAA